MRDESPSLERRKFLCVMGAAGAVSALGCGGDSNSTPSGTFAVGTTTEITVGTWKRLADKHLIVGRDAGGVFAFGTICPHEGFDVDFEGSQCPASPNARTSTTGNLVCCSGHGGRFNGTGVVTGGPPTTNLTHYKVTIASGNISVDTTVTVPVAERATV